MILTLLLLLSMVSTNLYAAPHWPNYRCEREYPKVDCPQPARCKGMEACTWACAGPVFKEEDLPYICKPVMESATSDCHIVYQNDRVVAGYECKEKI